MKHRMCSTISGPTRTILTIAGLANDLGALVVSKDADFVDIAERGLLNQTLV